MKSTIKLKAGYYPIDLGMFNGGGGDALKLELAKSGEELQAIPAAWLAHP